MESPALSGTFQFGIPAIKIKIQGVEVTTLVDTGFNGELMLPKRYINQINLKPIAFSEYLTAGGTLVRTQEYQGTMEWFGKKRKITVLQGPGSIFLIGMDLLHDTRLVVERSQNRIVISK